MKHETKWKVLVTAVHYFVCCRSVGGIGGISWRIDDQSVRREKEIEYDKQRDNKDGRTTVRNKGSYIGKEKGILSP